MPGWSARGDLVAFTVGADGFLYNMVRIMVGTLLRVQAGEVLPRGHPRDPPEARDRKAAGPTAPACGLYLNRVFYLRCAQERRGAAMAKREQTSRRARPGAEGHPACRTTDGAGPGPLRKPRSGRSPSPLRSRPGRKGRSGPRPPWRWRSPRGRKSAGSRGRCPRRCTSAAVILLALVVALASVAEPGQP